jgi:hypothetical protein
MAMQRHGWDDIIIIMEERMLVDRRCDEGY